MYALTHNNHGWDQLRRHLLASSLLFLLAGASACCDEWVGAEIGDLLFRDGVDLCAGYLGGCSRFGHVGVYAGMTTGGTRWVLQANLNEEGGTGYVTWEEFLKGNEYWGARQTLLILTRQQRVRLVEIGEAQIDSSYPPWHEFCDPEATKRPKTAQRNGQFRCDGFAWYCYETLDREFYEQRKGDYFINGIERWGGCVRLILDGIPGGEMSPRHLKDSLYSAKGNGPLVTVLEPGQYSTVSGANVTIGVSADDGSMGSGVRSADFYVYVDSTTRRWIGAHVHDVDRSGTYHVDWDSTSVADGYYPLQVSVTDKAGNSTATLVSVYVRNEGGGSVPPGRGLIHVGNSHYPTPTVEIRRPDGSVILPWQGFHSPFDHEVDCGNYVVEYGFYPNSDGESYNRPLERRVYVGSGQTVDASLNYDGYRKDEPKGGLRVHTEEWSGGQLLRKFRAACEVHKTDGTLIRSWFDAEIDGTLIQNLDPGDYRIDYGTTKNEGGQGMSIDPWWNIPGSETAHVDAGQTKDVWGQYHRKDWWAQLNSKWNSKTNDGSNDIHVTSTESFILEAWYINRGAKTWGNKYDSENSVRLGTREPMDRDSPFYYPTDWDRPWGEGPGRPTYADQENVGAEGHGRFAFVAKFNPNTYTGGSWTGEKKFSEGFALVAEGRTWLDQGDAWQVGWDIYVKAVATLRIDLQVNGPCSLTGGFTVKQGAQVVWEEHGVFGVRTRDLDAGDYVVQFDPVSNYETPASQNVAVSLNQTSTVTAVYRDTQPPTITGRAFSPPSPSNTNAVQVTATATDAACGVDRIEVWLDGAKLGNQPLTWDTSSVSDGSHSVELRAFDKAGNLASESHSYFLDRMPPTVPAELAAEHACGQVPLSWPPSTDPGYPATGIGMDGYRVFRALFPDGAYAQIATVPHSSSQLAFTDADVQNVTTYLYQVSAFDKVTNESDRSEPLIFTAGLLGDVNGDCSVDISDFVKCIRLALYLDVGTHGQRDLGDMSRDGSVDVVDVIRVRNAILGRSRQVVRPEGTTENSPDDSSLGTGHAARTDQVLWNSASSQGRLSTGESAVPSGLTVQGGSIAIPGVNSFAILGRSLRDEGRAEGEGACRLSLGAVLVGGAEFDLPLFLHGDAMVGGVQVELRFDAGRVEVLSVRPGALLDGGKWEVQSNQRVPGRLTVLVHPGTRVDSVTGGAAGVLVWVRLRRLVDELPADAVELLRNARAVTPEGESIEVSGQTGQALAMAQTHLRQGWQLVAPPLASVTGELADLVSTNLRPLLSYGWTGTQYLLNPPPEPGQAYWFFLPREQDLTLAGIPPLLDASSRLRLRAGWNLIGLPREGAPVRWSSCTVSGTPAAQAADTLAPVCWRWEADQGQYAPETMDDGELTPWQGRWVLALADCTVVLPAEASGGGDLRSAVGRGRRPAPSGAVSVPPVTPSPSHPISSWSVAVTLTAGRSRDIATASVSPDATAGFDGFRSEMPEPPLSPGGVSLHFVHPEWRSRTAGATDWFATDTRGPVGTQPTVWNLEATCDGQETIAQLAWADLSGLPKDVSLTLIDLDANQRRYLRTTWAYELTLAPGKPRRFQLVAERGASAPLRISNVAVAPTRGGGLTVQYALNKPAAVQATIRSAAGRVVGTMNTGRASAAGFNALSWDSRAAGKALPRGVHLIELTARTDDGQVARAVRTFRCQ